MTVAGRDASGELRDSAGCSSCIGFSLQPLQPDAARRANEVETPAGRRICFSGSNSTTDTASRLRPERRYLHRQKLPKTATLRVQCRSFREPDPPLELDARVDGH